MTLGIWGRCQIRVSIYFLLPSLYGLLPPFLTTPGFVKSSLYQGEGNPSNSFYQSLPPTSMYCLLTLGGRVLGAGDMGGKA